MLSETFEMPAGGWPESALVARGLRPLVATACLVAAFVAAVALVATAVSGLPEEPGPTDVFVVVVLLALVVFLGLCLPLAATQVRRARFRILVGPQHLTLRDGRRVAWADVNRIDADPMSSSLLRLWLVERTTPLARADRLLEQPNPVSVSLRGLAMTPERARALIEAHWRQAREPGDPFHSLDDQTGRHSTTK